MRKYLLALILFLNAFYKADAQFTDNFTDGNFTANPTWVGNTADWVVNPALQLQSNNTVANSSFYLSTASTLATTAQWDFYCNLSFNTSGANYADVYLTASASDLTLNATSGYFVRIGNTLDEIALYRKDASGTVTKIIDGVDGTTNTGNNILQIRVIRTVSNVWTLSRDLTGTGSSYFTEGSVTDATFTTSAFFGILIKQSTASFFQRHFFDDIQVQPYVPDITPPAIVSASVITAATVDVLFNESVDFTSAQTAGNYGVSNGVGAPVSAVRDAVNTSLVHLTFAANLPSQINLTLTVNGVKDIAGNTLNNGTVTFSYFVPAQYNVVIDEIMADPTPVVGLPDPEWVELKNTSAFTVNLQGWKLGKPTGESGPMPSFILPAGGYVIVCTGSAVASLSPFGPAISVTSFPSLNNTGDNIYLRSPQGVIIHSVNYADDWYKNELKKNGGWTLEMIDPKNPCTGINNWKASSDPRGGTPVAVNSANAVNPDNTPPKLLRAFAPDSAHITLVFDEPLDSTSGANAASYTISDGIGVALSARPMSFTFDHVLLTLSTPLLKNKIYTVTVTNATDCSGNVIGNTRTARVGLASATIDSFAIVINEILFNPKSNGVDYAEFYNRSNKIFNLKNASIANRNTAGVISSITQFISEDYAFYPGDYVVVTSDPGIVKRDYLATNPDAFLQVNSTPSFNDDAGDVILLNEQGKIIDEVKYSDKWHFALISNAEGVSLERIDPNAPSVQSNFHSAATNVGYGTPGYKNSQFRSDLQVTGDITVTPDIISPDNDGIDDFATIQYSFPDPGSVSNITVFDAVGRPVRYLQRNALNGLKGYYRWDGLGEKQQKLPVGIYVIYTEVFNLKGKTKKFKNTIVLARRQ